MHTQKQHRSVGPLSQTGAGSISCAMAHRKAAISRAIAVIATVLRFPFAVRRRYRAHKRLSVLTGLSLMGITLHINVHVWAGAIVAFALVAVLGLALGYRQHRTSGTLLLGIVGVLFVIFSLYGSQTIQMMGIPRNAVEIVGFAGLVAAGIWDWRLKNTCHPLGSG
jgi:MerC mercury resistance protein